MAEKITILLRREWYRPWRKKIELKSDEVVRLEQTSRGLRLIKHNRKGSQNED